MNIGGSRSVALASVALTLVVTACSSGTDETLVPLTDPPTTSTTAAPTSAPTTNAAPTTTAPTPIVETTATTTPADADGSLTFDDAQALVTAERDAYLAALAEDGDKTGSQLRPLVTPDRFNGLVEVIERRHRDGLATRRGTIEQSTIIELAESDALNREGTRTFVAIVCLVSDAVIYEVATGQIIDDSLGYVLRAATIVQSEEGWVIASQQRLALSEDDAACSNA